MAAALGRAGREPSAGDAAGGGGAPGAGAGTRVRSTRPDSIRGFGTRKSPCCIATIFLRDTTAGGGGAESVIFGGHGGGAIGIASEGAVARLLTG